MPDHATTVTVTFAMWMAMTAVMMAPAVSPWVAVVARLAAPSCGGAGAARTGLEFLSGYFATWVPYALIGATAQLVLLERGMLPAGDALGSTVGGAVLVGAGLFQFSPLKAACLRHCRSPLGFFLERWHDGPVAAWVLGVRHGLFCLGCCWALMAVVFAVGIMSLVWMAVLALAVWLEQVAPQGGAVSRVIGVSLIVWGLVRVAL